mmetsp:Transcript_9454/g.24108  ORF Transcript_9454/g.24108 Transcript_9454/m.24108 type:complete len:245 (+) Transcript_9454:28-762(+)
MASPISTSLALLGLAAGVPAALLSSAEPPGSPGSGSLSAMVFTDAIATCRLCISRGADSSRLAIHSGHSYGAFGLKKASRPGGVLSDATSGAWMCARACCAPGTWHLAHAYAWMTPSVAVKRSSSTCTRPDTCAAVISVWSSTNESAWTAACSDSFSASRESQTSHSASRSSSERSSSSPITSGRLRMSGAMALKATMNSASAAGRLSGRLSHSTKLFRTPTKWFTVSVRSSRSAANSSASARR